MAGSKIKRALKQVIEEAGGWDETVFDNVAAGMSLEKIAAQFGTSRQLLQQLINRDPDLYQRYQVAKRKRAERYADEALEIADGVREERGAIDKAKVRIDVRKWLAGVDDPERYGAAKQQTNITIGQLHLSALRKVAAGDEPVTIDVTPAASASGDGDGDAA